MNTANHTALPSLSGLVGSTVLWRWRDNLPGVVTEVMNGCNPLIRVDFGHRSALLPPQDLAHPDGSALSNI